MVVLHGRHGKSFSPVATIIREEDKDGIYLNEYDMFLFKDILEY